MLIMKLLNENFKQVRTSILENWKLEYGEHRDVGPRETETEVFVVNGDTKIKVATSSNFIGRDRDTMRFEWDRDGIKQAFPHADIERFQDDSVQSGTPKSDWWEPEVQIHKYLSEGVADKYAAKKWGIQDPDDKFEKQYQSKLAKQTGNKIGEVEGKAVIKNPGSLENFPAMARGVITKEGDLYMIDDAETVIHVGILSLLKEKGIITSRTSGWEDPVDVNKYGFLTVQRVWNKNMIAIGESIMVPKPRYPEERQAALNLFVPYFNGAKKKNPSINFVNNQVRTVARKTLTPDEYQKYKKLGS